GFASSLDADSEGEEGKFYVWSLDEITDVLGEDDAELFAEIYGVTAGGNFEGHNILNRLDSLELRDVEIETRLIDMRAKLLERRSTRIRPGFDDKVLADWNGLMIASLANAAEACGRADWLEAAEAAFAFVSTRMSARGRLFHAYRAGEAKAPATASDYANMIKAALALATVTGMHAYVEQARAWADVLDKHYWAPDLGGYYFTADDTSDLIVRPFSGVDEATPNANAVMASNLMALYLWTGEERYRGRAEAILGAFAGAMLENIVAHAGLLASALDVLAPAHVVLVVPEGGDALELRRAMSAVSLPNAVVQEVREDESLPASSPAHGKTAIDGKPTAYVCLGPQCSLPVTDPTALVETVKTARWVTLT
ncbi:MAG: thioredoxin domain-containing protein, partial [Methyloceanibacter sp.]